ncbi:MAG: methionine--tRNA ligase [Candidatus Nanoarchaeia archaeon]
MPKTFFITTPIYYPSGKPHIGHLYTDVCSDVLARWYRLKGFKVHFSTGTDEHGLKIQRAAIAAGKTPKEYVDDLVKYFKELCLLYNISYDDFVRTTEERHKKAVYALFDKIYSKKDVYKSFYEGLYCVECETYFTDKDLIDGLCPIHGKPPQRMTEDTYFFKMSKYHKKIVDHIKKNKNFILPEAKKKEVLNRLQEPLKDLSISRASFDWGIPFPIDRKHVFYVWVDALTNYLTTIGYPSQRYKKFWPADIHIIGNDISWHHTVIWPTLLMSAGIKPPKSVFVHGFIKANDNAKMSKSLGNVVDPFELIKHYPADSIRYFLVREIPFGVDGSFSEEALIQRHNTELANDLGNLLNRTIAMINTYLAGNIPKKTKDEITKHLDFKKIDSYMERRELHNALNEIWRFINFANKYINDKEPWNIKDRKELEVVLYNLAESLRFIAILVKPFMPSTSAEIASQLGIKDFDRQSFKHLKFGLLKGKVSKSKILFKKIEKVDDTITGGGKMENFVQFDEWKKLDIRVGTVKKAEPHPNADKLVILHVDIGEAKDRQLVAGLKQYYKNDELVGKRVIIFANLKPVNLRGVESNGMILAAVNNKDVVLLTTDKPINNGAKIE